MFCVFLDLANAYDTALRDGIVTKMLKSSYSIGTKECNDLESETVCNTHIRYGCCFHI